jgi:uncharacterized protein (TIGR03067 family)
VLTLRNGTFTVNYTNDEDTIRGSSRIDPTCQPPHLDWSPSNGNAQGQTLKFIYQIEGDTLRTAIMNGDLTGRPQGFSDKRIAVHTYKRVKKWLAAGPAVSIPRRPFAVLFGTDEPLHRLRQHVSRSS